MTRRNKEIRRVLAIDPTSRGFGFAVLEGADNLIDYGTRGCSPGAPEVCHKRVAQLLEVFHLDLLVLEDTNDQGCLRRDRIRTLLDDIEQLAEERGVPTRRIVVRHVRAAYSAAGAKSKHQMATLIAARFPQLASRLPLPRKAWETEAASMAIFDAVGMGLSLYS